MNVPDRENFGYYPMFIQYDMLELECPKIPNDVRVFHIPLKYDHNSIFNMSILTNFDLNISRMTIHYLHRAGKIWKSTSLEYSYDSERNEYFIQNYNKNHHLLTSRKYVTPYLEIVVQKDVEFIKEPRLTLGYTVCSWSYRSPDEPLKLIDDGGDHNLDFVEKI